MRDAGFGSVTSGPFGCFFKTRVVRISSWIALILCAISVRGATLSWSGGSATGGNWNDSANWGFVGTPNSGDTLIFSASQPRLTNTNNISNLVLNQIRFVGAGGGYVINGQGFTVTNNIEATNTAGANLISNNIVMASAGDFVVDVGPGAVLTLGGVLSGSVGLVKASPGVLILSGPQSNTYGGTTTVNAGQVELGKNGGLFFATAIPGNLVIGDGVSTAWVQNIADSQISDSANVTVNQSGKFDLNNHGETIGTNLTLNGYATVNIASGGLTMGAPNTITVSGSGVAIISGNGFLQLNAGPCLMNVNEILEIGSGIFGTANITKTGGGNLILMGYNGYTGLTTVGQGWLYASNYLALGETNSGTVVSNGATLILEGGISITNESLTLNGPGEPGWGTLAVVSNDTNTWAGPITLNADSTFEIFTSPGKLRITGPITGAGGLTQISLGGGGLLRFEGTNYNTYSGLTVVDGGTLELNVTNSGGPAVPNSMIVSNNAVVRLFNNFQLYQPAKSSAYFVTMYPGSLFDLAGFAEWVGPLSLMGANVTTAGGTIYLNGDITIISNTAQTSLISGNAVLYGSTHVITNIGHSFSPDARISANLSNSGTFGFIKDGDGEVSLSGTASSFTGPVTVNRGNLWLQSSNAIGGCTNLTVNSGGTLFLDGSLNMPVVALSLSGAGWGGGGALRDDFGSSSWPGNITLAADAVIDTFAPYNLTLGGSISGPGGVTFDGSGTNTFAGSTVNNYGGITTVNSGTLQLNKSGFDRAIQNALVIGDGFGGPNSDVVRLLNLNQIANTALVTIKSSGLLDENGSLEGIGGLTGTGNVIVSGFDLVLFGGGSNEFDGVISGTGQVEFFNPATTIFTGSNTYTGLTLVDKGSLIVNGFQPQSPIIVSNGAALAGLGTVGSITNYGTLSPGPGSGGPGMLTTSNLIFASTGKLIAQLNGPNPGSGYDQLNVRGAVALSNATLQVSELFTNPVSLGQQITLINNDGADAISGNFSAFPDGTSFFIAGFGFNTSYEGGTGNDLVFTLTNIPGAAVSASTLPGNGSSSLDPNSCDSVIAIFTNLTSSPMPGANGTLSTTNPSVMITQPYSPYGNVTAFGAGTNLTPFQISVLPSFACGNDINLTLSLSSITYGQFSVPLVLHTGALGAPNRYDVGTVLNIPDVGTIESTNLVSGFTGPLLKATVSLWITHPIDSDLAISLISPDGVTVPLSTANGSGANFGSACSPDPNRTTFDDGAGTSITTGSSPFVGTFRPQGSLATVARTSANGNWRLRITDSFAGSLGALRCWSLTLYPATCNPAGGGGACALCPMTITNTLTVNSALQIDRITRDGIQASCGSAKVFPTDIGDGQARHFEAYPFYNGASNACVTVTFAEPNGGCDLFSAAYLGSFNPNNLGQNYLGDGGNSTAGSGSESYSFNMPSNSVFVVTVAEVDSGVCDAPYTLSVTGGDCRPVLTATSASPQQVQIGWPTIAGGYDLESSVFISPKNWTAVTNQPIATTNLFSVTNTVTPPSKFYRLQEP
jgi:autotransporter-associated beta strand protein